MIIQFYDANGVLLTRDVHCRNTIKIGINNHLMSLFDDNDFFPRYIDLSLVSRISIIKDLK